MYLSYCSSQVHHPIDYARVVKRIGNEMDLTLVNLDDMLPAATVMVSCISVSLLLVTVAPPKGPGVEVELLPKGLEKRRVTNGF